MAAKEIVMRKVCLSLSVILAAGTISMPTRVGADELPSGLRARAQRHVFAAVSAGVAPRWSGSMLGSATALYRPDVQGIAYYEVQVVGADHAPRGFIVLSNGSHDYPIVQWSDRGPSPTERLASKARESKVSINRVYRLDIDYLAETSDGKSVRAEQSIQLHGPIVKQQRDHKIQLEFQTPFEMKRAAPLTNWTETKSRYADSFREYNDALRVSASRIWTTNEKGKDVPYSGNGSSYCEIDDALATPHYEQLAPHQGPNDEWYYSGCGPTAWAIVLAWESRQAAKGDPRFAPFWGTYHQGGVLDVLAPFDIAPVDFSGGPQRMCVDLRRILGTWGEPFEDQGVTEPWRMSRVNTYMQRLGFLDDEIEAATFDWGGGEFDSLRDRSIKHVCVDHVPALTGIGALTHYAVATRVYGYWFWLNMGHGGWDDGWYAPGVFFSGTMLPKKTPILPPAAVVAADGECLDIFGGNPAPGTTVATWDCKNTGIVNQRWWLDPDGELRGMAEKCLDVDHSNTADGARVQLWDCNGTNAQRWSMENVEIVNRGSKRCVDVYSMQNANLTPTQLWDCLGYWNQQWTFTKAGEIRNQGGRCLDVLGSNTADGTRVIIYDCTGNANQKWVFKPGGMIQGIGGKCLTASAAGTANGTVLQLSKCLGSVSGPGHQTFSLRGSIHGIAGKCLNAMGTQTNPTSWHGNGVQMWTCHGTENQAWMYVP
jgi:hypothetical protein